MRRPSASAPPPPPASPPSQRPPKLRTQRSRRGGRCRANALRPATAAWPTGRARGPQRPSTPRRPPPKLERGAPQAVLGRCRARSARGGAKRSKSGRRPSYNFSNAPRSWHDPPPCTSWPLRPGGASGRARPGSPAGGGWHPLSPSRGGAFATPAQRRSRISRRRRAKRLRPRSRSGGGATSGRLEASKPPCTRPRPGGPKPSATAGKQRLLHGRARPAAFGGQPTRANPSARRLDPGRVARGLRRGRPGGRAASPPARPSKSAARDVGRRAVRSKPSRPPAASAAPPGPAATAAAAAPKPGAKRAASLRPSSAPSPPQTPDRSAAAAPHGASTAARGRRARIRRHFGPRATSGAHAPSTAASPAIRRRRACCGTQPRIAPAAQLSQKPREPQRGRSSRRRRRRDASEPCRGPQHADQAADERRHFAKPGRAPSTSPPQRRGGVGPGRQRGRGRAKPRRGVWPNTAPICFLPTQPSVDLARGTTNASGATPGSRRNSSSTPPAPTASPSQPWTGERIP
mmetsp:Transcript_46312/g.131596  ORF Transcript_46312/g.131596 Transcript_46312/m.131596 type:complete len:518 (+) Transcript_46312:285-1838(+)